MAHSRRKLGLLVMAILVTVGILWTTCGGALAQERIAQRAHGGWQPGDEAYHPGRVIVRFADAVRAEEATETISRLGYSLLRTARFKPNAKFPNGARFGIVALPKGESVDGAVAKLGAAPGVMYVERDYMRYRDQTPVMPNDPRFPEMWGLHNQDLPPEYKDPRMSGDPVDDADIDMPEAWVRHTNSSEVIVGLIDTGAYIHHPDLADNIWVNSDEVPGNGIDDDGNGYIDDINGWDFFNSDNTVWDPDERDQYGYLNDEHGTHTAGTIGALTNNAMGVAGINWDVQIIILKFIGPEGGYTSDAILALEYATDKGAKLTSNSWGGGGYSQALKDAIEASGIVFVAAAGNSNVNNDVTPHYPSSYDSANIIAVGASMQNDERCNYPGWWGSNWGETSVDLFAPGGYILSTIPPDPPPGPGEPPEEAYEFFYGTSMATPHVAGVVAALVSMYPDLPQYPGAPGWVEGSPTVKSVILDTVDQKPAFAGLCISGGRLNAANAFAMSLPPVITSASADPTEGEPPLLVTFSASAMDPDGEIADYWWDFGDGSPVVHEYNTTHTYEEQGLFDATFHVVDDSGLESTATTRIHVFFPPEIDVNPLSLESSLDWGETETKTFTISNTGEGDLHYNIEVLFSGIAAPSARVTWPDMEIGKDEEDPRKGEPQTQSSGGPDAFGYVWVDSDNPDGPPFIWGDISEFGTPVSLGDDADVVVTLPFEFPFYGETKTEVRISSNGYLTFGATGRDYSNDPIPSTSQPNDLLAAFWDDLNPSASGHIYYYGDEAIFVVQYQDVPRLSSGGPYTFQVVLSRDGAILYNYLSMQGDRLDEATIGIENANGTDGLQVAFNQEYVHNELTLLFVPKWIDVSPTEGTVAPSAQDTVNVTFRANNLPEADWLADIVVHSDDPDEPEVAVSTVLRVNAIMPPVIEWLTAEPWAGAPPLTVHFQASAYDPDGTITDTVWDFGDGSDPVTGTLDTVHTYTVTGEYDATLTVTDDEGLSTTRSVHIVAQPLPKVGVSPPSFTATVRAHRTHTDTLTITNTGDADLHFTVHAATAAAPTLATDVNPSAEHWDPASKDEADPREGRIHPEGMGGPDGFGYIWVDSDQAGGPTFEWVDITALGTRVSLGDDGHTVVPLPWEFPFYGETKTDIRVCSNGYLTFGSTGGDYSNDPIPSTSQPNDLLAVWWDDLYPPSGGGVYHYYDTANERFVVEWYQVPRLSSSSSYTFQALLYPDGTIVYQYLDMAFNPPSNEAGATIGIENSDGTDGLEVLFNAAGYVHNGLAIEFYPFQWLSVDTESGTVRPGEGVDVGVTFDLTPIASGTLDGALVIETNDVVTPVVNVPVHIDVLPNQPPVISAAGVNPAQGPVETEFQFVAAAHDNDGAISDKYWDFGDGTDPVHEFVALHTYAEEGVYTATFHAIDNDGYEATAEVTVRVQEPPSASWSPGQFFFRMAQGQSASGVLTLSNAGPGLLVFGSEELQDRVELPERQAAPGEIKGPNALTARGIYKEREAVAASPWLPDDVGDVITSWPSPSPITLNWGVGVNRSSGNLVISDPTQKKDFVVTPEGEYTGTSWITPWAGSWPGDAAFDGTYIWQVNVGGDNGLYQLDPETGEVVGSITNVPWTMSQRGLAYNPNDDTFYVGGWNEDVIYHIKGLSWDDPGGTIEQWSMPVGIAGLAYHPVANVLVVASNAAPDMIYFVDPVSHATMAQFPHPAGGSYGGAGIDFDSDGNLWVASQNDNSMYLIETGLGAIGSWLTWDPTSGVVRAGESIDIDVEADASRLAPGDHSSAVVLFTNDLEYPMIVVPVNVHVCQPPVITEASAQPTLGEPPLAVTFHAAVYAPEVPIASYGWDFGDGSAAPELDATHTYTAQGSYLATFTVTDQIGGTASVTIPIEVRFLPAATVEPDSIETSLPSDVVEEHTVTIGNVEGHADLNFSVKVRQGLAPAIVLPKRVGKVTDQNARTAAGLYEPLPREVAAKVAANVRPNAAGDVLMSWDLPSEIVVGWGVGFDEEKLWISDPEQRRDFWTTTDGALIGSVGTPWAGSWPADMAYDPNHNLVWQVNVGGDNGLYGLDPETGDVVATLRGSPWTGTSQRGVAYDADTDTFYIGGWNEDIIYHVKGLDWDVPGQVIEGWTLTGAGISGLAWHPDGILWVSTNSPGDYIYGLDLEALEIVYQFPGPAGGDYLGAGLELHSDGNLWAVTQDNKAWLISTDMPIARGIVVEPTSGTVAPGETMDLTVTLIAADLGDPGEDVANYLEIVTNDPWRPVMFVNVLTHILPGPTISDVVVEPTVGEPPLEVSFSATVTAGAAPIADVWWDFGDGSEPVHEPVATHTYTELGTYEAAIHVVDELGVEVTETVEVQVKWLPVLEVDPESFDEILLVGTQDQEYLTISNAGNAPMNFWVNAAPNFAGSPEWKRYAAEEHVKGDFASEPRGFAGAGAGGPDAFGYIWMDSNQPGGPAFDWFEINEVGTPLPLDDESGRTVALPFPFPFYGEVKTQVGIASNGYLSFDTSALRGFWTNTPIPDPSKPNDLIAVFWDDLDPGAAGNVYYYHDEANNRFIVEFEDVPQWGASAGYTFQVILKPDGTIICQYLEMTGSVNSATVGVENASGEVGLQVTYNAPYIENGLAVAFSPVGALIEVNPTSGYLLQDQGQDVVVTFGSPQAAPGTYSLYLYVCANDPYRPLVAVPVRLKVNQAPVVRLTAPVGGEEWLGEQDITWTAIDADDPAESLVIDLYYSRDGVEWHEIAKGLENTGTYRWNTASVGEGGDTFRVRAVATDPAGAASEDTSDPFAIVNAAPVAAFAFAPSPATVEDVVRFTDASTDDGHIVSWSWEFGDDATSTEQNPTHQYVAKGTYTVKLTVTDNGGLTSTAETTLEVVNVGPEVTILQPEAGVVWTGTKAIGYEVTDPDDNADEITMRFEYDYLGDDHGWKLIAKDQPNTGEFVWDTSQVKRGGLYKVRVVATDPDGAVGEATSGEFTIVVLSRMVVASPNPASDYVRFYYDIQSDGTLYVYDIVGRLVHSVELASEINVYEWNLMSGDRPLANGLYLYLVVTEDGEKSDVGRLVISH
ncbi:MAG: PKD domain-containing protein [Bacteroidota bacterium]